MHPMLQESCDEAMACAQMEYDKEQAGHNPDPQPVYTEIGEDQDPVF